MMRQPSDLCLAAFGAIVSLLCSSAQQPMGSDEAIREGNTAFSRADYPAALRFYQQAQERGTDPGLIAFNQATALYHLKKYDEAENHYRRALDDDSIPAERRARALYDLGNCLVRQARPDEAALPKESELPRLKAAIIVYEMCLDTAVKDATLHEDAAHNLELAKLLWSRTRRQSNAKEPPTPNDGQEPQPEKPRPPEAKKNEPTTDTKTDPNTTDAKNPDRTTSPSKGETVKKDKKDSATPRKSDQAPPPGAGKMVVIRDPGRIEHLSPEKTREYLRETERRLTRERQAVRRESSGDARKAIADDW